MPELISFTWNRPRKRLRIEDGPRGRWLVPAKGGEDIDAWKAYEPFKVDPPIWQQFHGLDENEEAIADFASRYGLLSDYAEGMDIEYWRTEIKKIRKFIVVWTKQTLDETETLLHLFNNSHHVYQTNLLLSLNSRTRRPELHLIPLHLIAAIWIQLALHLSGETGLRLCKWCGEPFLFGSGTGRRKSGHFCSDKCRKASWKADQEKRTNK